MRSIHSMAPLLALCWLCAAAAQECTQVPNAMLITSAYAGSAESVAKSAEECCNLCKSAPKAPVTLTCQVWTWCPWDRSFQDPCITTRFGFSEPAGPGTCFLYNIPEGEGEGAKADCQARLLSTTHQHVAAVPATACADCPWVSGYTTDTNPLEFQPPASPELQASVDGAPEAAPAEGFPHASAPELTYGDACEASSVEEGTMLITPILNGDFTAETQEQCCGFCNKADYCHVWSYCPFSGRWTDTCLTTRFNGTEEKARPKACLLWTLEPGAEPIVDQTDSRWISGRKPIAGAGGAPEPAPPAVAAPPSGAAAGASRAAVLLASLVLAAWGVMGGG